MFECEVTPAHEPVRMRVVGLYLYDITAYLKHIPMAKSTEVIAFKRFIMSYRPLLNYPAYN